MTIRLPPVNALLAFEAVARHASFSKAAEELCVTHGAVSHRIKLLENHLGTVLIDRSERQLTLTRAGRLYLARVTQAISLLHSAENEITVVPERQKLKINALPGLAGSWLISRLGSFRARHPEIDIEIDPLTYPLEQFDAQKLDVAIRYCAGDFSHFRNVKLIDVFLYPVCSPHYQRRTNLSSPADLARENLLVHQADPWDIWFHEQGLEGVTVEPVSVFGDSRLLVDAAAHGDGIALVRHVVAESKVLQGDVIKLFDSKVQSPKAYYAITKPSPRQAEQTELFLQWFLEQADEWKRTQR